MFAGINAELLSELRKVVGLESGETSEVLNSWDAFLKGIASDPRFAGFNKDKIKEVAQKIINAAFDGIKDVPGAVDLAHTEITGGKTILETIMGDTKPESLLTATDRAEATTVYTPKSSTASYSGGGSSSYHNTVVKPKTSIDRFTAQWKGLATEHKVGIGMSATVAGLMGATSLVQTAQAFKRDEQGKIHVDGMRIASAAVSMLLAVGTGYLAHSQFKAVAH